MNDRVKSVVNLIGGSRAGVLTIRSAVAQLNTADQAELARQLKCTPALVRALAGGTDAPGIGTRAGEGGLSGDELGAAGHPMNTILIGQEAARLRVVKDERDLHIEALDNFFAGRPGGFRTLREAYAYVTDTPPWLVDGGRVLGSAAGYESSSGRSTESVTSSTWSKILGDSVTRRMVAEYQAPDLQTWRLLVSDTRFSIDFRTQRVERMGGYGTLPVVNQGAPYQPLTTPTNEEATFAASKKGGTEDLTLEAILNDDVGVQKRLPIKLGRAAAQTLYRFVFDLLDANATCTYDSVALFHASHGNTAALPLSQVNLSAARRAMRKQTAYGDSSDVLGVSPRYLLVASDLEELAFELAKSAVALPAVAPAGGAANTPNIHQGIVPVTVDYWSSATQWITMADPKAVPTIELGFTAGDENPDLIVQNAPGAGSTFSADKITFKVRHAYSGAVADHRGFYRGNS